MARDNGLLNLSANFEVQNAAPLDARQKTALKADLINAGTFGVYPFVGMLVSVFGDSEANNGVYVLKALPSTTEANWLKIVLPSEVLTKTNTTAFTPTADYHPATKQYVDTVASEGGGSSDDDVFTELQVDTYGNVIEENILVEFQADFTADDFIEGTE
jgi:hypothetical protein